MLDPRAAEGQAAIEMGLSERERAMLDFERSWWTDGRPKEAGIQDRFQLSPSRYYHLLTALLDSSDALAYDPLVVRRLRRLRDRRRRARFERRSEERPGR